MQRIAIASDHAATELKTALLTFLQDTGHAVTDLGTQGAASVDYPDYANLLCKALLAGACDAGILLCGSGIGMSIAANRHPGIRAALCHDGLSAELSRRHNDANVLCLGARLMGIEVAKECVMRFLNAAFEGGRHADRVKKLG